MSIPAVLGAAVLELKDIGLGLISARPDDKLLVGAIVGVVGYHITRCWWL